jgi:hypothetical protein
MADQSTATTAADETNATEPPDTTEYDGRKDLEASAYIGIGVDSFAASDLKSYLNPESSNDIQNRAVGGFDFEYRLSKPDREMQLWIYGETLHGVRSTDIDCSQNPDLPTCQTAGYDASSAAEQFLYIVQNASSLEGMLGLRWELFRLRESSQAPSSLYVNAQAGFLSVSGDDDDVVDMHHTGLGLVITNGQFQGSRLEVGYGTCDLFSVKPDSRWIVDGLLSWTPKQLDGTGTSLFAQIYVNTDVGSGADSIQSYFGIDIDLREFNLFGARSQ